MANTIHKSSTLGKIAVPLRNECLQSNLRIVKPIVWVYRHKLKTLLSSSLGRRNDEGRFYELIDLFLPD